MVYDPDEGRLQGHARRLIGGPKARCYGTRPAEGGNKAAKLKAIREALRTAKNVWLATDCDREGQLIGQEILKHYEYRGQVMRVLFTAQDSQTKHSLSSDTSLVRYVRSAFCS